jgi:predicted lysophospholipase L1 biosynthesis ABC-type transport system permease subunit
MILNNKIVCTTLGATTGLLETAASTRCSGVGCAACMGCIAAGAVLVAVMMSRGFQKNIANEGIDHGVVKSSN